MSSRSERMNGHTGIENGPDSYGRQQLGILGNGGNSDPATPREGRRFSDCKTANYVPAAAVIRRWRALSGITGRKGSVGGSVS